MQQDSSEIKGQSLKGSSQWVLCTGRRHVGHTMMPHVVSNTHCNKWKQGRVLWHLFLKSYTCLHIFLIWTGFEARSYIQAPHVREKKTDCIFNIYLKGSLLRTWEVQRYHYTAEKIFTHLSICESKFKPSHFKLKYDTKLFCLLERNLVLIF